MDYSPFLFLRKVEQLAHGLKNIYELDNDAVDDIVQNYVRKMYERGVMDVRIESAARPEYFNDRAAVLLDSERRVEDWNVLTFQYTAGILENTFVVLLYRPDKSVTQPVKDMEKYLPEWVEVEDSED